MATSKEALELDGIPPGREGLVDDAVELLSEAASEALSVKVGAIRPEEVLAPAPASPAPDEAAMPVAGAVPPLQPAVAPMEGEEEYESHGMALDRPALLPPPPAAAPVEDEEYESDEMALDRAALLRPITQWQSDDEERRSDDSMNDARPPIAAPETAPAPAPAAATPHEIATALADLVAQVDEASAANSLFSELLLKVAQVARPVKDQERIGD